jgi:hypothetical protein
MTLQNAAKCHHIPLLKQGEKKLCGKIFCHILSWRVLIICLMIRQGDKIVGFIMQQGLQSDKVASSQKIWEAPFIVEGTVSLRPY